MAKSRRKSDYRNTVALDAVVDSVWDSNGYEPERITDATMQKNGVDVVLHDGEEKLFVDEKAAITCWDRYLRTYAIEFSSKNNKNGGGWFSNSDSMTTHYAFIFPRSETPDMRDLTDMEILLVEKKALKSFLHKWSCDRKEDIEFRMSVRGQFVGDKKRCKISDDLEIVQSLQLAEQPVCVLVNREVLRALAIKTFQYRKAGMAG